MPHFLIKCVGQTGVKGELEVAVPEINTLKGISISLVSKILIHIGIQEN
jgi:hypothetical protein